MITKKIIKSEIDRVPKERLEELYKIVKIYSRSEAQNAAVQPKGGGDVAGKGVQPRNSQRIEHSNANTLFSKLKRISIDGPEDFSENLDLYLNGEKTIG